MADIFSAIIGIFDASTQIREYVIIPIKNQYSYLFRYNNIVDGLRVQNQELNSSREHLQGQIQAAENNLQVILPHVKDWCRRVDELKEKAERILGDEPQDQNGACMHGTCPDLKLRYSLSREAMKLTADAVKLQKELREFGSHISDPAPLIGMQTIPVTSEALELDSRRHKEEEIMSHLRDNSIRMIGIWGMGGVGKTTMAKKIGKKATEEKLFVEFAMAVVSQQVDVGEIQRQLAEGLGLDLTQKTESVRARQLHARLKDKKVLIILDDVWKRLNLEEVGIPCQMKILLTSRDHGVCQMMSLEEATKILRLEGLDEEEAFSLFRKNAGSVVDQSKLQLLGRDVAKECKGLPLALVTVGCSLKGKTHESTWKESLRQLQKSAPKNIPGYLEDVFQPLKVSYEHLESNEGRDLFLLCCLFPEDSKIEIENLVRYGVGLRIFSAIESINDARNRVHYLVKMLIDRCLLMDADEQLWPTYVKMHDVIRDMALLIATSGKHVFMVNHDKGLREWPESDSDEDYTCISLTLGEAMAFPECIRCPGLKALLLTFDSSTPESKLPVNFFNEMGDLRLLSINWQYRFGDALSLSFPLKNLRVMHLDGHDPQNIYLIGQLVNLEIFSCRRSLIQVLPDEIGALTKLKLLDLSHSRCLRNIALGVISKLVRLEELWLMNCPIKWEGKEEGKMRSNASLAEIFSLRNLRFIEIWIRGSELISQKSSRLQNLTSYYILISEDDATFDMERSYTDLKRVKVCVNERKVCLNTVSMLFRDVEELYLQGNGSKDMMDPLARQGFERIKHLKIDGLDSVKHLASGNGIFPVLRYLELKDMNDLVEICHGPPSAESFSQLEYLSPEGLGSLLYLWKSVNEKVCLSNLREIKIKRCKNLKWVFSLPIAESLCQLQSIEVWDCPMIEELFKNERGSETGATTINHIKFSSLNRMILRGLPRLCALCKAVDVFEFPSMKTLEGEITEVSTKNILVNQLGQVAYPNLSYLCMSGLGMEVFYRTVQISISTQLQELEIKSFDSLRTLFSSDIFKGFTNLRKLTVESCLMLEDIVKMEENEDERHGNRTSKIIIPKLEKLILSELPKIYYFCSFSNALELPSLEIVSIRDCPMMETFALNLSCSSSMSNSSIPRFFFSEQVTCPNLQRLVVQKLKISGQLFSHEKSIASLRELRVGSCHNLKSLFSPRTFGGLTNLQLLSIFECLMLEQVVAKEDVDNEGSQEMLEKVVVMLPNLYGLKLQKLPKLRGFSHMHSDLELPSLTWIDVRNCIEMKTTFSLGRGSVRMPKGVKVDGMGDPEFASKFFFKGENRQDEDGLNNDYFMLLPSDLSFSWDSSRLPWVVKGSSNVFFPSGWRKVSGKFDMTKLSLGIVYEIVFVIMLVGEQMQSSEDTPELEIILVDDKRRQNMMDMPTNQWVEILAGDLRPLFSQCGEITFSLEKNNAASKRNVVFKGVGIRVKEIVA